MNPARLSLQAGPHEIGHLAILGFYMQKWAEIKDTNKAVFRLPEQAKASKSMFLYQKQAKLALYAISYAKSRQLGTLLSAP